MIRLGTLLLSACLAIFAQSMDFSAGAGYSQFSNNPVGYLGYGTNNVPVDAVEFQGGPGVAFRFGVNQSRWLGHEIGALYTRHELTFEVGVPVIVVVPAKRSAWQVFYDLLVYATDETARVRPFAAAGVGAAAFRAREVATWLGTQESTEFALNYGGGVKVNVSSNWLVRFDFREYRSPKPLKLIGQEGWLAQREFSASAGFRF